MSTKTSRKVLIVGGGPAGLSAAYRLAQEGVEPRLLEKRDKLGGIACTEEVDGFLFDRGGHRFLSKDREVNEIWKSVLGDDFLVRPRLSRIYYKGKFLDYPLKALNAWRARGSFGSLAVASSYARWRLFPYRTEENFEKWVTNRFGERLYRIFFKSYTEKVWGIPCAEISSVWAAQRIKNLSLKKALARMLPGSRKHHCRTLIDRFHYPRRGPSMMWEAMRRVVEARGGAVHTGTEVTAIRLDGNRIRDVIAAGPGGEECLLADHYVSSMPLTTLLERLRPAPPDEVLQAARRLRFCSFHIWMASGPSAATSPTKRAYSSK